MRFSNEPYFLTCMITILASSCVSKNIISYYNKNKITLDHIEQTFREESKHRHFTIEFIDKSFDNVSLEVWTDSLKYIYEFNVAEKRLADTLVKYKLPVQPVNSLIQQMQSIHCTWVNNLEYYTNLKKSYMVFISIRPRTLNLLSRKKYYIITYFNAPQYYDKEGRLLVTRKLRKIRKINADIFHRINDKVAYTLSDRFR